MLDRARRWISRNHYDDFHLDFEDSPLESHHHRMRSIFGVEFPQYAFNVRLNRFLGDVQLKTDLPIAMTASYAP